MKFNRELIIQAIIAEKEHFLKFLDHINAQDTGGEIPLVMYLTYFEKHIRRDPAKDALKQLLSLESLIDNGFFVNDNRDSGKLAFNKVILDLLTFIDTKRNKQLSNIEFDDLRSRTISFAQSLKSHPLGSADHTEALSAFKKLLIEINTKVQENVFVLQSKANEIAEDYKAYEAGESVITINDLYRKVSELFHRNVKPFLDFTTTDQILVVESFSEVMMALIAYFEGQNDTAMAISLSYRKTAITSFYKDIRQISKRLRTFLDQLGKDQSHFMAVENAYAQMIDALMPLRHGGSRNIKLKPDAAFFADLTTFDGLSDHKSKYGAKLNMNAEKTLFRFELYLEAVNAKPLKTKQGHLKPLPAGSYIELERQTDIARLIYQLQHPASIPDVYRYVHTALQAELDNFSLKDTLFGIEVIASQFNTQLKALNVRSQLTDPQYYLDYSVLEYREEYHHG
jgi:hypothetical protein